MQNERGTAIKGWTLDASVLFLLSVQLGAPHESEKIAVAILLPLQFVEYTSPVICSSCILAITINILHTHCQIRSLLYYAVIFDNDIG